MNGVTTWGEAITVSMIDLWGRFVGFLPTLFGAILVFVFGWVVAVVIGKVVEKVLKTAQLDKAVDKVGLQRKIEEVGLKVTFSEFFGGIIKWFLVLVFLMAAADILKLNQVTVFLNSIVLYLPNVVVSVVILSTVFLVGNFVYSVVKGSTRAAGVVSATLMAAIAKWAIIIFGIFAALIQLGIASSLVSTLFIGLVAMVSLAGGLAFGLGGRDEAAEILAKVREEITENK